MGAHQVGIEGRKSLQRKWSRRVASKLYPIERCFRLWRRRIHCYSQGRSMQRWHTKVLGNSELLWDVNCRKLKDQESWNTVRIIIICLQAFGTYQRRTLKTLGCNAIWHGYCLRRSSLCSTMVRSPAPLSAGPWYCMSRPSGLDPRILPHYLPRIVQRCLVPTPAVSET